MHKIILGLDISIYWHPCFHIPTLQSAASAEQFNGMTIKDCHMIDCHDKTEKGTSVLNSAVLQGSSNNNNNEHISRVPFHVKHAEMH